MDGARLDCPHLAPQIWCAANPVAAASLIKSGLMSVIGRGSEGGRRVITDYCYSSRHFISCEISISPPYWACFGTDLPSHTMFPLSTSDDQTAGPQMLLLSKKLVKAPWDDAFHFWHFPLPRDETGLLWSALDQEERNWAVVSALLASKQTVFQIWLGLIN